MLFQEYGIEIRALPPTNEFFRMHRHYNSGLSDIVETIYGSTTIEHMISVKAISRAIQRHMIVDSFLDGILLSKALKNRTVKLWIQYMNMVDIFKTFIKVE